jgi:T5SS/PEP-CTERM-associated repeat protein/autotransporter-associated beta strand protein/autotransporter passenger strand-loop-strand repeat protein
MLATSSLAVLVLGAGGAQAQTSWQGTTSADWFGPTNWSTNAVPTAADKVIVDQGTPNPSPVVGINGTGNAALSNTAVIGDLAGTAGTVTVVTTNAALPASWTISGAPPFIVGFVPGALVVGGSGTGSLTITNGGLVDITGHVANAVIGSVGTGTVTVGNAASPNLANPSTLANDGPLFNVGSLIVGDTGTGTLLVNPDGVVRGFVGARVAESTGSQGTVVVNGGNMNVIDPGSGNGELDVGLSGHGTLTVQNGGTLTSVGGIISLSPGSAGSSITVTGANSVWNLTSGGMVVGNNDTGSLSILAGGTVQLHGANIAIGSPPNATGAGTGTVTVDNASLLASGGIINIGVAGSGTSTMTVQNGGHVTSDGGEVGGFAPASVNGNSASTGVATVTGPGSLWDAARDVGGNVDPGSQIFIDNPTSMTGLVIKQGGQVISGAGSVGDFSPGAVNTVVVDGAGSSWTNLTSLSLGYFQPGFSPTTNNSVGVVNVTNGGQVLAPTVVIGVLPDSTGAPVDAITVNGAGSSLKASSTLAVGLFGTGNLTISGGATVTSGTSIVAFSSAAPGLLNQNGNPLDTNNVGANSAGTVLVTDPGSTWNTSSLIVGDNASTDPGGVFTGIGGGTASGTLTVANGGAVNSTSAIQVALNAGATGTINIGAADGQAAAAPGTISAPAIVFGAGTGTIVFNHTSSNYVFGTAIQGAGSVIVDSGTTALTAVNSYTGPTVINGGVLEIEGSLTGTSSVTVNASGTLMVANGGTVNSTTVINGGVVEVGGSLTGSSVTVNTGGTLTVANGGTVDSTTVINGGAVEVDGSLTGSSVTVNAGGTLTVANGGTVNSATAIQVALNAGSTGTINIGAADGQAAVAPGTISAPAIVFGAGTGTIVFNHNSSNYVFGTAIQGAGSVIVDSGTTALTAVNSYTGPTVINGGVLEVDGSLTGTSAVTVNAGGTLTGSGTIDPLTVSINNGGSLLAGNGVPGASTKIVGNLAFQSGASYNFVLNPTTSSLTSVTGTATLSGATANAFFANGAYVASKYTVLTASGGVSGTFGSLVSTNLPPIVTASLSYDANDVFLNLKAAIGAGAGLNQNQQNAANDINNFFNNGGTLPPGFVSLFNLAGSNLATGLTQLSGETATGSQQTTFDAMNLFIGLITDPFVAGRGDLASAGGGATGYAEEPLAYAAKRQSSDALAAIYTKAPPPVPFVQRWSVWAAGFGGSQTTDGSTTVGSNTTNSRIAATAVGADYHFSPNTLAGFAIAGGGTSFNVANSGYGRSDLFQAGAFIHHNAGPAYVTAALAYGWQDVITNRTVTIAGIDQLQARFNANSYSGRVEGGYRFVAPWTGGIGITPYAAGQFTTYAIPAYAEGVLSGNNTFALAYGAKNVTDTRSELGIRTDKSYAMTGGILTLRGRFAWAHDFDPDRGIGATFQTLPGASFVVNGAMQAHDSALTTASAEMKWVNGLSVAATFEGEFSNVTASYAGKGVVRYQW